MLLYYTLYLFWQKNYINQSICQVKTEKNKGNLPSNFETKEKQLHVIRIFDNVCLNLCNLTSTMKSHLTGSVKKQTVYSNKLLPTLYSTVHLA